MHTQESETYPRALSESRVSVGQGASSDVFEEENPLLTIQYLKQYLSRKEVENCQLRGETEGLRLELSLCRAALAEKDTELSLMRSYRDRIEESVQKVTEYNQQYIQFIEAQQAEIADLRHELHMRDSAPGHPFQPEFTLHKRFALGLPQYEEPEREPEEEDSASHGSSVLERAKEYVRQVRPERASTSREVRSSRDYGRGRLLL